MNDNFIKLEDKNISTDNTTRNLYTLDDLVSNIKEKYKIKDDGYVFSNNKNDSNYEIFYIKEANLIIITKESKKITEEWMLYIDKNILDYKMVNDDKVNNIMDIKINDFSCDEKEQNTCDIVNEFWNIIDESLK